MAAPKAPAIAAAGKTRLTREEFCEWTRKCRVRKIQKNHIALVREAEAHGTTPEEELKAKGFRDFHDFHYAGTAPFSLNCSTGELGEMGVGFVLYFRLVRYLALVLFFLGIFQIPAMITYSGSDVVTRWLYYTNWKRGYEVDPSNSCACLGSNRGVHGPDSAFSDPIYGTSCRAWDVDTCFAAASPFTNPGKWCCRSWCFADPLCKESADPNSPSLSARWYKGMVRVSSGCPQNATLLADRCGSLPDEAFNEFERLDMGSIAKKFIGIWWLTPGSLGPDSANQMHILVTYVIGVLFLCLCILTHRQFQMRTIREVDEQSVTPNDFAIMVKGLPPTVTDEGVIADFFKKHAVQGKDSTEVVKVVIGWDSGAFREKMNDLNKARASLHRLQSQQSQSCLGCCGDGENEDEATLQQRIFHIKKSLYECAPGDSEKLLSSGTVVVVFRWQRDLRACLMKWQGFWQRWSYCQQAGAGMWPGDALPTFGEEGVQLQVTRAANPGDIHWDELGHTRLAQNRLWMATSCAMLVLIAGGFVLSWLLNEWQASLKDHLAHEHVAGRLLSILPATVISLINFLLRVAGRIFGSLEYQETWGQEEFSQGVKMFWSMLINTACVVLFINAQPQEWYRKGGLVDDVFYMLVIDSIVARLCLFCDVTYAFNYLYRRQLTDEKLACMNDAIVRNCHRKTPEQEEALEQMVAEIDSYKQAYEPEELDNPDRYARVLVTFLCSVFFAPVFPAAVFIGMAGLILQYALDKVLLLKWYKRPRPQNEVQAIWSLQMLKVLAPLALSAGMLIFLMPSWDDKREVLKIFLFCLVMSLVMASFPSRVLAWFNVFGWISRCCFPASDGELSQWEDYYHAQYMWTKDMHYHVDQPLYKQLHKVNKEKNPTILKPEQDHRVKATDLRQHYQSSVMAVCMAVATHRDTGIRRKGRPPRARDLLRMPSERERRPDVEEGSAPEGADVPICLRVGCGKPTWNGQPNQHCGRTCRDLDRAAEPAISPEAITVAPCTPRWEFEAGSGFKAYADDCQAYIESRYQVFLKDSSRSQVTVVTGSTTLTVDFAKMTQKLKDGRGRERLIRRTEVPDMDF